MISESYSEELNGQLVIDETAEITNANGQTYTAKTAPVIINTGAAGYSAQENQKASFSNAAYGYINVACGNRGKQSTATDEDGNEYYTGDAPLCLVDQKNAIRFVKYNIVLGNLPGNTEYFVSTGGSGGGAHAAMVAATSGNSDYFPYEVEAGAAGIYQNEDGTYSEVLESEEANGAEISDGVWGCVAYSAITSLQEADMAMAFECYLDTDYDFNTDFQKKMAEYLSEEYMNYINDQNLSVSESAADIDINEDGDKDDVVDLTIEYDAQKYADTNGYGGTYLSLYLKEFEKNLQWYLENLDYADDWTWFDNDGNALSDEEVAQMTTEEKAQAFLEGRYAKGESGDNAGPGGGMPGGPMGDGNKPDGNLPNGEKPSEMPDGEAPNGEKPDDLVTSGMGDEVGTPDAGTTQSAGNLEWQWDGGHVPSEIFGESLSLYIDEMYGKYVEGAAEVTKTAAQTQTENGTATEATGTDISSWASYQDGNAVFSLADAVSYRTKGANKAIPGFDVMDYGQETYEFGSTNQDARHFDKYVLKVLQEQKETLEGLFNQTK